MKVKEIISAIEEFAPLSIQEGWDNSGLCVGSPEDEVTSVLLALDCTPELVDEAVACGADMIVTHHPLIFKGLKTSLVIWISRLQELKRVSQQSKWISKSKV